uniref:Uncharacterized protein n=1 Tax=Timema tahoe TaxID=61484 RepID=A0A7R9FKY1_9NEOP|nr:unnamed protein product [Timema tahoe]
MSATLTSVRPRNSATGRVVTLELETYRCYILDEKLHSRVPASFRRRLHRRRSVFLGSHAYFTERITPACNQSTHANISA